MESRVMRCPECKETFETQFARKIYCSKSCASKASNDRAAAKRAAIKKPESKHARRNKMVPETRSCAVCGTDFETDVPGRLYCSKQCCTKMFKARHAMLLGRKACV